MEAIEESQVNDRSIMEATVIERQDHSGRIRFKTTLPSGRNLNSEWIQESDKAKAGVLWAEAVRGQIVADSQNAVSRARQGLRELRATAPSATPKLVGVDGSALQTIGLSTPAGAPSPTQTVAPAVSNPSPAAYVRTQHSLARAKLDQLRAEYQRIGFELKEAEKTEAQWFGLLQAMGVERIEESISGISSPAPGSGRNGYPSDLKFEDGTIVETDDNTGSP